MYYVIVLLAFIVVMGVLIVLRTVASNPPLDEGQQDGMPASQINAEESASALQEGHESASLAEEKFSG
jgi:hypothetical protein